MPCGISGVEKNSHRGISGWTMLSLRAMEGTLDFILNVMEAIRSF